MNRGLQVLVLSSSLAPLTVSMLHLALKLLAVRPSLLQVQLELPVALHQLAHLPSTANTKVRLLLDEVQFWRLLLSASEDLFSL